MSSRFLRSCVTHMFITMGLFSLSGALPAADAAPEYRTSLTEVYGKFQGVLARRDACNAAFPQARGNYEKAFTTWHARHKNLITELEQRVAMMIRSYSRDESDYARNFGKYEGALLQQREEVKTELLRQLPSDLEAMCKAWPSFLQSADSDLEKELAEDLAVIRKRPLAKK